LEGTTSAKGRRAGKKAEWNCDCALLHDLVVVHGVSDVDVSFKGKVRDGRVEVEDIGRSGGCLRMQMCI
jgi:hypothetical protein